MKPILGTGDKFVDWRTKTNQISENVGDPDSLVTDDKSSLVAAVNSSVALLDGNLTKTTTGGTTTLTASEFSNGVITVGGVLASDAILVVPDVVHKFIVTNETTGTYKLEVKTSAQIEPVEIEQGSSASLYCDGSTVVLVGGAGGSGSTIESELPPEDPAPGDKWIKTSTKIEYTWLTNEDLSGQWVETGAVMNTYSTLRFYEQTVSEGQTEFMVTYTPGFITVYMNGYRLSPSDYVATNGTSVVLNVGGTAGDEMLFEVMGTFAIANAVSLGGNETISGIKTFSSSPNVPTPTEDMQASTKKYVDDSVAGAARPIQFGTCATAAATATKVVELEGFTLTKGAQIDIVFDYTNTVTPSLALNVNSTGAVAVYTASGVVSATNPAYFPAGCKIPFVYDGTHFVLQNRVVKHGTSTSGSIKSFWNVWASGFVEQGAAYNPLPASTGDWVHTYPIALNAEPVFASRCIQSNSTVTGPAPKYWYAIQTRAATYVSISYDGINQSALMYEVKGWVAP